MHENKEMMVLMLKAVCLGLPENTQVLIFQNLEIKIKDGEGSKFPFLIG